MELSDNDLGFFWLLLLFSQIGIPSSQAQPTCPAEPPCFCTDLRLKCLQQQSVVNIFPSMPYFVPPSKKLRWSYSFHEIRIREQAMTDFSLRYDYGVITVKKVEASNCLIRNIAPDAFRGLIGIESLNLSYNYLDTLNSQVLIDLPSLRQLILHNNNIRTVHPDVFQYTPFLSHLYISSNRLQDVPAGIVRLTRLTHLYLQFNNISVIKDNSFNGLKKLIILDLSSQFSFISLEPKAFCGTSMPRDPDAPPLSYSNNGLVALYMRSNRLKFLDLCTFGKIESLRGLNFTKTWFPCSCQVLSFLSKSNWRELYGFAPLFVSYERSHVLDCLDTIDCGNYIPKTCSNSCATVNTKSSPRGPLLDVPYEHKLMIVDEPGAKQRRVSSNVSASMISTSIFCLLTLYLTEIINDVTRASVT